MSVPSASALPTRLLHISDLHVGTREAPQVERSLATLVNVVVLAKDPADEEVPAVLFAGQDTES